MKYEEIRRRLGHQEEEFSSLDEDFEAEIVLSLDLTLNANREVVDAEVWGMAGDGSTVEWLPSNSSLRKLRDSKRAQ